MRSVLLAFSLLLPAQAVARELTQTEKDFGARLIRRQGHPCREITRVVDLKKNGGLRVHCGPYRYRVTIQGGMPVALHPLP